MRQSDRVRPAYFFWRKCYTCKKMRWHLGTGLKGEPYFCTHCMVKEDDAE